MNVPRPAPDVAESVALALGGQRKVAGFASPDERAQPLKLPPWFIDRCRQAYLSLPVITGGEHANRLIGVSSAVHGEGKTSIAAGIATAIAVDTGERTLLMECDFSSRHGIGEIFRLRPGTGLAEWMSGDADLRLVRASPFDNAFLLPAGGVGMDATRLMYRLGDHDVIGQLRSSFRNIVIDLPPMNDIAYSSLAGHLADHVLLVVQYGRTTVEDLEKAMFLLGRDRVGGVILNRFEPSIPKALRRLL